MSTHEGGGLDLVDDAEPSWWRAGDLPAGLPHPERVWRWWREQGADPPSETARQARHRQIEQQNTDSNGDRGVGHPSSQPPAAPSHRERESLSDEMAVGNTNVADEAPAAENGSSTRGNGTHVALSGGTARNGAQVSADVANDDLEDGNSGSSDNSTAHAF